MASKPNSNFTSLSYNSASPVTVSFSLLLCSLISFSFTSMILPSHIFLLSSMPSIANESFPQEHHSCFIVASLLFFCASSPIWQISCPQPSLVPALQLRVAFPRYSARKLKTFPTYDPQMYFGTVLLNAERHTGSTRQPLHTHTRL